MPTHLHQSPVHPASVNALRILAARVEVGNGDDGQGASTHTGDNEIRASEGNETKGRLMIGGVTMCDDMTCVYNHYDDTTHEARCAKPADMIPCPDEIERECDCGEVDGFCTCYEEE